MVPKNEALAVQYTGNRYASFFSQHGQQAFKSWLASAPAFWIYKNNQKEIQISIKNIFLF